VQPLLRPQAALNFSCESGDIARPYEAVVVEAVILGVVGRLSVLGVDELLHLGGLGGAILLLAVQAMLVKAPRHLLLELLHIVEEQPGRTVIQLHVQIMPFGIGFTLMIGWMRPPHGGDAVIPLAWIEDPRGLAD